MSQTTTVSERALIQRINRVLAREDGTRIRKSRPGTEQQLGEYFAVSEHNAITAMHIDLETWAREAGVLRGREVIAQQARRDAAAPSAL